MVIYSLFGLNIGIVELFLLIWHQIYGISEGYFIDLLQLVIRYGKRKEFVQSLGLLHNQPLKVLKKGIYLV